MQHSLATKFALLPHDERDKILGDLTAREIEALMYDWTWWGRPAQFEPTVDWDSWLILAGRGFGKTRTGAETVRKRVCGPTPLAAGQCRRIALIAETAADARDVMVEGQSGILGVHPKAWRPIYEPSKRRITWPNGAVALIFNATEPDQLRGPEHDFAWCDELAKWQYAQDTYDNLQFGLRIGKHPQEIITTTPRPIPLLKKLMKDKKTVTTRGSTYDNKANLARTFFDKVVSLYEGTRIGRQELRAEILDDVPGALWSNKMLDALRVKRPPELTRIVVSVDPSGTRGGDERDLVGIVVVGLGTDGRAYLLADRSASLSPAGWARRVCETFHEFEADQVIGEVNFGGDMVRHTIQSFDATVPFKEVRATRGKWIRAEPIASLYEQKRVKHVGVFEELEEQLVNFTPSGYAGDESPDRADAHVFAVTELLLAEYYESTSEEFRL